MFIKRNPRGRGGYPPLSQEEEDQNAYQDAAILMIAADCGRIHRPVER